MKRKITILALLMTAVMPMRAAYYSINIDYETAAAMVAAYNAEGAMEFMGEESTSTVKDHYEQAELAAAGIFLTKYMDRKYLMDAGIMGSAQENAYYKRVYRIVSQGILPKTWEVAKLMLEYPDRAFHWVPFLIKTCEDTKALCVQFESIVSNGSLGFGDLPFLSVKETVRNIFDSGRLGGTDWQEQLTSLVTGVSDITEEDLQGDLDGIVSAGASILTGADASALDGSSVEKAFGGTAQSILQMIGTAGTDIDGLLGGVQGLSLFQGSATTALANLFDVEGYDIEDYLSDYSGETTGKYYTQIYYIYYKKKTRLGYSKKRVYTEVYDSYDMDLNTFLAKMNAKLDEYNHSYDDKSTSRTYYLGSKSKRYYEATDANKVKSVSAVTYTVSCDDGQELGEGSTSWKEDGDQGDELDEQSKEFAMQTTLSGGSEEMSELEALAAEKQQALTDIKSRIEVLEAEQKVVAGNMTGGYDAELMSRYQELEKEIKELKSQLAVAQSEYEQTAAALEEARAEYGDETDEVTRIPSIMHDLETAYHISWTDEGSWEDFTFVRHGTVSGIDGTVTFRAELSLQRTPSYFWGIRYHRAILQVDWKLTAEYSYENVVEVMTLDADLTAEAKAKKINKKLSEIAEDYPDCKVTAEYKHSKEVEDVDGDDTPHLLWAADRLAIAREVESRLVAIYTKLAMLEKYIESSKTLKSYVFDKVMGGIDKSKRKSIGKEALERWKESALSSQWSKESENNQKSKIRNQ